MRSEKCEKSQIDDFGVKIQVKKKCEIIIFALKIDMRHFDGFFNYWN